MGEMHPRDLTERADSWIYSSNDWNSRLGCIREVRVRIMRHGREFDRIDVMAKSKTGEESGREDIRTGVKMSLRNGITIKGANGT